MNTQQRASAVEKAKGCPKCTGWGHQKQDCRMKPRECGVDMGSSKCSGDHSKMLHGSGNIYCAAVGAGSAVLRKSAQRSVSESDLFACVNEHEDTLYYLQDIPIKKSKANARVLWDRGSNRVLIRDDFAKELKLISKEVIYNMVTVGDKQTNQYHGFIYLIDLVDMHNNVRTVWGYGVPKIMFSSVPDLAPIRHLFPHLPDSAFQALSKREVDVLIGLNMNELQPGGGVGPDKVGGLSALRSLFGSGWVVGGHHELLKATQDSIISSAAAILKIAKLQVKPEPCLTPEFWEAEGMGVLPPARCDSCRGCMMSGACSQKKFDFDVKKQAELDLIKRKTRLIIISKLKLKSLKVKRSLKHHSHSHNPVAILTTHNRFVGKKKEDGYGVVGMATGFVRMATGL